MTRVDLRGREQQPEVRKLLAPAPGWLLVGWSRDNRLVACVGLERTSDHELAVRSIGAGEDSDAVALLEAVAGVATASRLVADADQGGSDLYRQSGFVAQPVVDDGRRWVRVLDERQAPPDSVRAGTLGELETAIRCGWGRDTSDDPEEWSLENPARGQCAVTALLVRELLGGEILVAHVLRGGRRVERHAWNRLPSGLTLDLTREQFTEDEQLGAPSVEEPILCEHSPERFATLRARVLAQLAL